MLAPPSAVDGKPYQLRQQASASGGLNWSEAVLLLEPNRAAAGHRADPAAGDLSRLIAWTAALRPDSHNRNDGLFWAACRVAETGNEAALAELAVAARATGLGDREIHSTIESARQAAERRYCQRQGGLEGAP